MVACLPEFIRATNFEGMTCNPQNAGHYSIAYLPGMSLCCSHIVFSEEGDPKGQDVICLKGKTDPYRGNRNFRLAQCFLSWSSIQTGSPPVHSQPGWALNQFFFVTFGMICTAWTWIPSPSFLYGLSRELYRIEFLTQSPSTLPYDSWALVLFWKKQTHRQAESHLE